MSLDNNDISPDMQSILSTIHARQNLIKSLETEVNDLRYVVSEHVKAHGPIMTDSVKASLTDAVKVTSYDKDQIDIGIAMLSTAVAMSKDPMLSEILNVLVKARKESVRPGSLRITFK